LHAEWSYTNSDKALLQTQWNVPVLIQSLESAVTVGYTALTHPTGVALTKETPIMIDANEVLKAMCEKYQAAVSANDSVAYGKLFAADAIHGIAQVEGTAVAYADGTTNSFQLTKTWLLHQETSGEWLIKRQMWNLK
jgi:hypothetical protein